MAIANVTNANNAVASETDFANRMAFNSSEFFSSGFILRLLFSTHPPVPLSFEERGWG